VESPASTDPSAPLARLVLAACRAFLAKMETTETTEPPGPPAHKDQRDPGAYQVCRAFQGPRVTEASLAWMELRERLVLQEPRDPMDLLGRVDPLGLWAQLALEVRGAEKGPQAPPDSEESTGLQDHPGHPADPANQGPLASRDQPGPRETWGSKGLRGPLVCRAAEASRAGPGLLA